MKLIELNIDKNIAVVEVDIFFGFMHGLELIVKQKVDIVIDDYIHNSYFRNELDKTKQLIYG